MTEDRLFWGLIVFLVLVIGGVVLFVINETNKPTISLIKEDWECTKTESRTQIMPTHVGKTTIMVPRTYDACMRYERK